MLAGWVQLHKIKSITVTFGFSFQLQLHFNTFKINFNSVSITYVLFAVILISLKRAHAKMAHIIMAQLNK